MFYQIQDNSEMCTIKASSDGISYYFFPPSFEPGRYDVIMSREKITSNRCGNVNLRRLVAEASDEYAATTSKNDKIDIMSSIINQVRTSTPRGAFVKQDQKTKRWFDVGDFTVREKISRMFRDARGDAYKSSASSKKKILQRKQAETKVRCRDEQTLLTSILQTEHYPKLNDWNMELLNIPCDSNFDFKNSKAIFDTLAFDYEYCGINGGSLIDFNFPTTTYSNPADHVDGNVALEYTDSFLFDLDHKGFESDDGDLNDFSVNPTD